MALAVFMMLVTLGCDRNNSASNEQSKSTNQSQAATEVVSSEAVPTIGSVSSIGKLILHVFHSIDTPPVRLPVELEDDYGFMIFNDGTLEEPQLKIRVGSKQDSKVFAAKTWEEADAILAKIPEVSGIHYYGKCTVPTYYGLPDDTWDRFMALIQKHKLTYADSIHRMTCTCSRHGG